MALKYTDNYDKKLQQEVTAYGPRQTFDEHQVDNGAYSGDIYRALSPEQSAKWNSQNNPFTYNPSTDPAYQAYRQQYLSAGQRATQNTLAQASAATGGRPSSYAISAAAQAGNNYAAQLSDKIPELYNQAYNRYTNQRDFEYQTQQDRIRNMQNQQAQEHNIFNTERNFQENTRQNRIQNMQTQQAQDWSRFMQQAQLAANVGDYQTLQAMGFNVSRSNFNNDFQIAQLIAQYTGDTSMLRSLMGK